MEYSNYVLGKVGDLFAGDILRIPENGEPTDYVVIGKGLMGTGTNDALLFRREPIAPINYVFASAEYQDSAPDKWLSHGYVNILPDKVRAAIVPATLTCWDEFNKVSKTLKRKCFLLSATELGFVDASRIAVEGTAIPYFSSNDMRKTTYFGAPAPYGTRTPMKSSVGNSVHIISVGSDGTQLTHPVYLYTLPLRPAMIISADAKYDLYRQII